MVILVNRIQDQAINVYSEYIFEYAVRFKRFGMTVTKRNDVQDMMKLHRPVS